MNPFKSHIDRIESFLNLTQQNFLSAKEKFYIKLSIITALRAIAEIYINELQINDKTESKENANEFLRNTIIFYDLIKLIRQTDFHRCGFTYASSNNFDLTTFNSSGQNGNAPSVAKLTVSKPGDVSGIYFDGNSFVAFGEVNMIAQKKHVQFRNGAEFYCTHTNQWVHIDELIDKHYASIKSIIPNIHTLI